MSSTGSEKLDFAVEQVWGPDIFRGDALVLVGGDVPSGWEVRETYWVIPNLTSAQLLVPRNDRVAARTLADFAGLRPTKVRVVRRVLAAAVRAGLPLSRAELRLVCPAGGPATTIAKIGSQVGHPEALATFGVRTAANAKPTLELRSPQGDALGFVKLAWNSVTMQAIDNEASALQRMGQSSRSAVRAPRVLADAEVDGRRFVMIEPLPRGIRHVPGTYSSLSELEALGPGSVSRLSVISGAGQVQSVLADLGQPTSIAPGALVSRVRDLAGRVVSTETIIPVANFWHGDFTWWNTGRDLDGQLWLFDWETAQRDTPAGMDTLHWYAHTVDAENAESLVKRVGSALGHCTPLLRSLGYSEVGIGILAAWYAVTLVANEIQLAESLQSWERIKHPPEVLERFLEWGLRQLKASAPVAR